ncbi:MAG: TonB-dependent receptor [Bdellovibrionales bacterium]|nr:TonB-dependent receptor [Bdellovibrionales bacterium]
MSDSKPATVFLSILFALAVTTVSFGVAHAQSGAQSGAQTGAPEGPQEAAPVTVPFTSAESTLETIHVLGASRFDLTQPTAPTRVSKKKLEALQTTNVGEALKSAPGVYIREEDGQGLRPNIGMRGTNPDRSKKIVLLQDGVLAGPAPYSAPAAYYTPSMFHTSSLDVMSGFTSVHHGPNSIGGAINYLTPDLPNYDSPDSKFSHNLDFSYGSFETAKLKAVTRGAVESVWGQPFAYHLQLAGIQSKGFKVLDGGGETGFSQGDVYGKFRFGKPLTFSFGLANELSKETYLGLSEADFSLSPYRRYRASAVDEMNWNHWRVQADHETSFENGMTAIATVYHRRFRRDWYRLDRFRGATAPSLRDTLNNPSGNPLFYEILRGADSSTVGSDGQLQVFSNDRSYQSEGVQLRLVGESSSESTIESDSQGTEEPSLKHSYQGMLRLHRDRIDRDHTYDFYEMAQGQLSRTATPTQQDRLNSEEALSLLVSGQDDISMGPWVLTAVGRIESVGFKFVDKLTGTEKTRSDFVVVPGAGLLRKFGEDFSARVSANRAVTVTGLDIAGSESREEAMNYELGLRYFAGERDLQAEMTFFYNDYANLTGTCTASSGCATTALDSQISGGKALITGVEAHVAEGVQLGKVWLPMELGITLLSATFKNSFTPTTPGDWGAGAVVEGDPLPYVPTAQYRATFGAEWKSLSQELQVTYQSKTFDQSAASGRVEIPAFGTVDYSASLKFDGAQNVKLKLDNILGREYAVGARPFGLRPGKPFSASLSYLINF